MGHAVGDGDWRMVALERYVIVIAMFIYLHYLISSTHCGVELLGTSSESIERAEDRELFKELCESIGEPTIPSEITYSIEEAKEAANRIGYPVVLRPAFTLGGTGGGFAYNEEDLGDGKIRTVLKLKPALSPVKAAVIPLARNVPELLNVSNDIVSGLRKLVIGRIELENSGNIGKNYRRHDEIGTPVCITVDHQTLEDNCVTLRNRDTMQQERVAISELNNIIADKVSITSLLKTLQ